MDERLIEQYKSDVEWLKRNIPPEQIYDFAEQSLMAATFFLAQWDDWVDLDEECDKSPVAKAWISNVLKLRHARQLGIDEKISTDFTERLL